MSVPEDALHAVTAVAEDNAAAHRLVAALEAALPTLQTSPAARRTVGEHEAFWTVLRLNLDAAASRLTGGLPSDRTDGLPLLIPEELEVWVDLATLSARTVRNVVAQGQKNQARARDAGVVTQVDRLLLLCAATVQRQNALALVIRACGQALSNILTANADIQDILWPEYMSRSAPADDVVRTLLLSRDVGTMSSGLVLVYNCICDSERQARHFVATRPDLVRLLLQKAHDAHQEPNQNFEMIYNIFQKLFQYGLFTEAYDRLSLTPAAASILDVTTCHLSLLRFLDAYLSQIHSPRRCMKSETASYIGRLFTKLSAESVKGMQRTANGALGVMKSSSEVAAVPGVPPAPDQPSKSSTTLDQVELVERDAATYTALVLTLQCLGIISQDSEADVVNACLHENVLESAIETLAHAHATLPQAAKASFELVGAPEVQSKSSITLLHGLKRDLVKLIGNLAYSRTHVQDAVRELGGLQLVLQMCNIDDNNPYLREHAIFAIRNLLDNNLANQHLVDELKPLAAVQDPVLQNAGIESRLDDNGKPQLAVAKR